MKKHAIGIIILSFITIICFLIMGSILTENSEILGSIDEGLNSSSEITRHFSMLGLLASPFILVGELMTKIFTVVIGLIVLMLIWSIYLGIIFKKTKTLEEQIPPISNAELIKFDKNEFNESWDKLNEIDNTIDDTTNNKLNNISIFLLILTGILITIYVFLRLF